MTLLRILFVGRTRYRIPLADATRKKFDALHRVADVRVLASAAGPDLPDDDTFHLVKPVRPRLLDGVAFHFSLPVRVARELRDFEPDAVLVTGAHDVPAEGLAPSPRWRQRPELLSLLSRSLLLFRLGVAGNGHAQGESTAPGWVRISVT